ncbi:hypothetical protein [Peribacillus glennii]|uniref:Uncharacterized protein n=1 Tax=Peribacillus glennii TaxID=2303991 RepID=A0A372L809_9BACI|nr:hypothetical protein [Peribacillus glennii]RFU60445.1 hypothetical protein D0466_21595 [Peribacillus glennii]
MDGNFFADYKKFIVLPDDNEVSKEEYDPRDYDSYYILTLSLYDSLISSWSEAIKHEIDINKSIETVLGEFNKRQKKAYHLQLLELDDTKSYFIMALSCKTKMEDGDTDARISYFVEKMIANSFYVGQSWYKLVGDKARVERKLFRLSYREYKQ